MKKKSVINCLMYLSLALLLVLIIKIYIHKWKEHNVDVNKSILHIQPIHYKINKMKQYPKIYLKQFNGHKENNNSETLKSHSSLKLSNITHAREYFHLLKSPTWHCRKLARFGGELYCPFPDGLPYEDDRSMSGQKVSK